MDLLTDTDRIAEQDAALVRSAHDAVQAEGAAKLPKDFPLRLRHVPDMMKGIGDAMRDFVGRCLAKRDVRLDAIEQRMAELEQTAMRYEGVHAEGKAYGKGVAVTHKNGLWIAQRATCDRPGESKDWRLAARGSK